MAYDALVERTVSLPRSELFAMFHDFGGIGRLLPDMVKRCECVGEGVGALRTIEMTDGGTVVERMEIAHDESVFAYSIITNDALPIENYCAVVTLADAGNGTTVSYGSNWNPTGDADEDDVRGLLEGLYATILDAMERTAKAA